MVRVISCYSYCLNRYHMAFIGRTELNSTSKILFADEIIEKYYRNWYIPRLRSLLRHQRPGKLTTARGRSPRAVVSFPGRWWRNNDQNRGINFYSIMMKQNQLQINKRMQGKCSKLPQNCLSYSMVTCAQLAIVQWSHVTWLFLPGNTCSNHCDVKTRFVTLNFSHTLHKNNWQNTHCNSW